MFQNWFLFTTNIYKRKNIPKSVVLLLEFDKNNMDSSEIKINDLVQVILEQKNLLVSEMQEQVYTQTANQREGRDVQVGSQYYPSPHYDFNLEQHKKHHNHFISWNRKRDSPNSHNTWKITDHDYGNNGQFGFTIKPDIHGNEKKGPQWIEEQKRRHNSIKFNPGQKKKIHPHDLQHEKICYIEPSQAQNKLENLRRYGAKFEDDDFPANHISLQGDYGNDPNWQPIQWKKISATLFSSEIFKNRPEPMDIKQGFLGDCYFLAGLSALAEKPHRILDLFLLKQKNQLNYYSVKMLYRGKWRTIDLDDSIPFLFSEPAFSKSICGDLWVIILQKAWAKIYGSYKQIEAGFPEEPLHDLTGAPIHHLYLKHRSFNPDQAWDYLLKASKLQYSMVASSRAGSDTQQSSSGVVQGHAYTFLNAVNLYIANKVERLVQLRNPWGDVQFRGKWSDYDPAWNYVSKEQKQLLNFKKNKKDGTFFMSYEDFIYQFRTLSVAQINDNASYVYRSYFDPQSKGVYFRIDIAKAGVYSLQVDNTPERSFTGEKQRKYSYPEIWMELGKLESTHTLKMQGKISHRRTLYKKYDLTAGTYVAWVKIRFNPQYEKDFDVTLAIYSEYACGIDIATKKEAIYFSGNTNVDWQVEELALRRRKSSHMGQSLGKHKFKNPSPEPRRLNEFQRSKHKERNIGNENFPNSSRQNPNKWERSRQRSHHSSFLANSSTFSPSKGKKIRQVKKTTEQVAIFQESPNGELMIKTTTNENTTQTVQKAGATGQNIVLVVKDTERTSKAIQDQFNGEVLKITEDYEETIVTKERAPNGEMISRTEKKSGQIETLQEEESQVKYQNEQQIKANQENYKIHEQAEVNSEEEQKIRQQMERKIYGDGKNKYTVLLEPSENASQAGV